MKTQRGLSVTTDSMVVIDAINHFHQQILSVGPYASGIVTAAEMYPENVLIQTYAAAYHLLAQEDKSTKLVWPCLLKAEKNLHDANLREKLIYQTVCAWLRRDYECTITLLTSITQLFPRDTLALKFAEWLFYCSGQFVHAHRYLALCEHVAKENQDESHFLAMHAFAWQLTGHYAKAKTLAGEAILMERCTPWAHHSLAHSYLLSKDWENGIKCLRSLQDSWETIMPLLKGHNTWHLALFYMANRSKRDILDLIDSGVFNTMPETVGQQIDIISLLWRMDLAGMPQQKRFDTVKDSLQHHPFEHYMGFNNAHYIYCLSRANDNARVKKSIHEMEQYAASLPFGLTRDLWHKTIIPFCKGIVAFIQMDYKTAYQLFKPIIDHCFMIGGSDAQNELFYQMYLICLIRCNQKSARKFFNHHLSHYKQSQLEDYWFSRPSA